MAGNYAPPYRPLVAGSIPYTHPNHLSGCDTAPRWRNVTRVNAAAFTNGTDASGGFTYSLAAPHERYDVYEYLQQNGNPGCTGLPPGTCGTWLLTGDLKGISARSVLNSTDDIVQCILDTANTVIDHNCYSRNRAIIGGNVVSYKLENKDFKKCKKVGGKWVVAKKMWYGVFGLRDQSDPNRPTSVTYNNTDGFVSLNSTFQTVPPQVKYLTKVISASHTYNAILVQSNTYQVSTGSAASTSSVSRYTGIISTSGNNSGSSPLSRDAFSFVNPINLAGAANYFFGFTTGNTYDASGISYYSSSGNTFYLHKGVANDGIPDFIIQAVTMDFSNGSFSRTAYMWDSVGNAPVIEKQESITITNTTATYNISGHLYNSADGTRSYYDNWNATATLTLSDSYYCSDLQSDAYDASNNWLLDNDKNYPWRTDGELARSPLIVYDEVPSPVAPAPDCIATMDDYSLNQDATDANGKNPGDDGYVPTWHKRGWLDPNNYQWLYGGSPNQPDGFTGGATLQTGLRNGSIVSHSPEGFDRHFWFSGQVQKREPVLSGGLPTGQYTWFQDGTGDFSHDPLPECTLRWMKDDEAQYDALSGSAYANPVWGNQNQSWARLLNGVFIVGKYVETKLQYPSVNFGRPYGLDVFAVDQETVCVVFNNSAGQYISRTRNAKAPLSTGGIHSNDYVAMVDSSDGTGGVYQIFSVASTSDTSVDTRYSSPLSGFSFTLGAKVADLPADFSMSSENVTEGSTAVYLGKLRWWKTVSGNLVKPPPFGLLACSAVWNGTDKTTLTIPATPYWVSINGAAITLSISLCSANAATGNPVGFATAVATKINAGDLTVTIPDTSGSYATQTKFIIPQLHYSGGGFDPSYDDDRPKGDFVMANWDTNLRQFNLSAMIAAATVGSDSYNSLKAAYEAQWGTYPPVWYGTSLTPSQPQVGVTAAHVGTYHVRTTPCCPSIVGVVTPPMHTGAKIENFKCSTLNSLPATFLADDLYGSFLIYNVATTMPDPFWQVPFYPDGDLVYPDSFDWKMDDGSGQSDKTIGTLFVRFFPHYPLVEAISTLPNNLGYPPIYHSVPALPSGVSLAFDATQNLVAPTYFPTGIPIGDTTYSGLGYNSYASLETAFGFYSTVCTNIAANGRFTSYYQKFVSC